MRIYSAASEEAFHARKLLADWAGEGFVTSDQHQHLKEETVFALRTTNIFLRLILFLFTLISVCAAAALFFALFLTHSSDRTSGIFLLVGAALIYAAAELAVSRGRLYRYGIEEALAVASVAFLCVGIELVLFSGPAFSPSAEAHALVPLAGAVLSLWIWHRFGLWYAVPAAMIFTLFVADYLTSSAAAQRTMVALLYAVGLACLIMLRTRHRFECIDTDYSLAEAFVWLGVYLVINLKLSSSLLPAWSRGWSPTVGAAPEYAGWFYWTTWVLTWIIPPLVLLRGIRRKDRFIIAVGAVVAVLTFITNKPYLGWARHTWDPMLLGIFLTAVVLLLRRWLARGPAGIRGGFTAARLSGKDKQWMTASSAVLGFVTPQSITPNPQPTSSDFHFGGGASGGGGAGGDY